MTASSPTKPVALETRWLVASPELKPFIRRLTASLEAEEDGQGLRQRRRKATDREKFMRAVESICCNFAAVSIAFGSTDARAVAVRLGSYASSTSMVYGAHFNRAATLMEGRGLIVATRGFRYSKFGRAASTIRATALYRTAAPSLTSWDALRLEEPSSVILVNTSDGIGRKAAIEDLEWLATAEAEVRLINAHLQAMSIQYSGSEAILPAADMLAQPAINLVTPHHRSVRRIFKDTVEHGGRLYGGYWETMPRAERFRHLTINDEPVVNVDYSQLFPRLAYAKSNQPPPAGDLYDLTGSEHKQVEAWDLSAQRIGRKRLLNAMLFADGSLRQWPGGSPQERSEVKRGFAPLKIAEASEAIRARHEAIAGEWLGRGRGLELMRIESDLLVAVLLRLIGMGIGALPLHDSVLVARSDAEIAQAVMREEALRLIGVEIPVKIDAG